MNLDCWVEGLRAGKLPTEHEVRMCCERLKEMLIEEPNVVPVPAPVTICGDIHGQFFDLLELLRLGGEPPHTSYIFIGDFVDRGHNSVETWLLLMLLKLKHPERVTLLRGNHECRQITIVYGFWDEVSHKYGNPNVWGYCMEVFDLLPLGALVDGRVLCVHGGLSPDLRTIDQIRAIERNVEIPHEGPFCDLMWSDPDNIDGWLMSARGAGWIFGAKVTQEFNHVNGLELVARAHQLVQEGYQYWFAGDPLVTVWSAPNYCYRCGNLASFLRLSPALERTFTTFKEVPESAQAPNPKNVLPYFL